MSIWQATTGLLSLNSRVGFDGKKLVATTNRVWQVLSLGGYRRRAVIDTVMKRAEVTVRKWWLFSSTKLIGFEDIEHIEYEYGSMMTSWSWFHGTKDSVDSFVVKLAVAGGGSVAIAAFRGEGARMTGVGGVFFSGDGAVDYAGDQEDASFDFVELVEKLTGAKVGARLLSSKNVYACEGCGRAGAPRTSCIYCGAKVVAH